MKKIYKEYTSRPISKTVDFADIPNKWAKASAKQNRGPHIQYNYPIDLNFLSVDTQVTRCLGYSKYIQKGLYFAY